MPKRERASLSSEKRRFTKNFPIRLYVLFNPQEASLSWSGLDQREFPRVRTRCDILIRGGAGGILKASTENLGAGGVCVILGRELEKFSPVHIRLVLEEEGLAIESEGRVVWTVRHREFGSTKVSCDTGIEFVHLKPQDQERLNAYLQRRG
jgi:hypothetical protein